MLLLLFFLCGFRVFRFHIYVVSSNSFSLHFIQFRRLLFYESERWFCCWQRKTTKNILLNSWIRETVSCQYRIGFSIVCPNLFIECRINHFYHFITFPYKVNNWSYTALWNMIPQMDGKFFFLFFFLSLLRIYRFAAVYFIHIYTLPAIYCRFPIINQYAFKCRPMAIYLPKTNKENKFF